MGFLISPAYSQDVKTIIDKIIDAQGGRKLLESIKDSTSIATMDLPSMGMSGTGTMYNKEPNKMRLDLDIMGMIITQACDGETAWEYNSQIGVSEPLTGNMESVFINSAYGNSAFLAPEKYGISYELKGNETINGKEYLLLERIYPDKYTIAIYIDPETFLIYKFKQESFDEMQMEVLEESVFSDYKKVDGVMTPFSITILHDGAEFAVLSVSDVQFNTGLDDSFFKMSPLTWREK